MDCCVFVHFGQKDRLSRPDFHFVLELSQHFSRLILVTNEREFHLDGFPPHVELMLVKNEGYDFGMFYKVFQNLNWQELERLALVNDSNLLLGDINESLRKGKNLEADFWGLIDSKEKPWFSTHADNYHLQSHFLVWEKSGIHILADYFKQVKLEEIFAENDPKTLRRKVINAWEIGLSQYFLSRNSKPKALFSSEKITGQLRKKPKVNLTMKYPEVLLEKGYPLLKKKYIQKNSRLARFFQPGKKWETLLQKYLRPNTEVEEWISELKRV